MPLVENICISRLDERGRLTLDAKFIKEKRWDKGSRFLIQWDGIRLIITKC